MQPKVPFQSKKPIVPELKKELGLFQITAYGVGLILGAGIYVLAGLAAGEAGNMVWLSFMISAVVALLSGLSYAELASKFPSDAGEYYYAWKALGSRIAFIVGSLVVVAGIISAATVALGFARYFSELLVFNNLIIIAIAVTLLFSLINFIGIKQAAWINVLFTAIEVGGLIVIILMGISSFGTVDYTQAASAGGVLNAAALIFFSFLGFQSIVKLSEETKNPEKTIPKALILSIIITTIIYILVGISIVSVMDWQALGASSSPLADVAEIVLGSKAFVALAIVALFSTGNTVLIGLISISRMIYGMSRSNCLPKLLGRVNRKTKTPVNAIILSTLLVMAFISFGDIKFIAQATNFVVFLTFIMVNLSLILIRKKEHSKTGFRVPLSYKNIPIPAVLAILVSAFMLINLDAQIILLGIGLLAVLIVVEAIMHKALGARKSKIEE
jgi:APA family basic amino acid/polyamine antiporter